MSNIIHTEFFRKRYIKIVCETHGTYERSASAVADRLDKGCPRCASPKSNEPDEAHAEYMSNSFNSVWEKFSAYVIEREIPNVIEP